MKILDPNKVMIVFSGGQDSTTCLGWALDKWERENIYLVSFSYGQKHSIEIETAKKISSIVDLSARHYFIDISAIKQIGDSALVTDGDVHQIKDSLPSSFVPGRNVVFLTHAAQLAYKLECKNIVTGTCQTDYSGYPDCRDVFIKSLNTSLSLAMGVDFHIHTPLMWLNKKETWQMAKELCCLDIVLESHTCYEGNRTIWNDWGYGCGECPSCILRKKGYEEYINQNV